MMRLRIATFAMLALFALPAVASAGPIQFGYGVSDLKPLYDSPLAPELGLVLRPFQPPGPVFTFDPAANAPVNIPALNYVPSQLPPPPPIDIHPDGTTHWNFEGYFHVDVTVTDLASGQSQTVPLSGRAHVYNRYSTADGWTGDAIFWFKDAYQFTLGGNDYTIWGANDYSSAPASVNVWVGADPPVHLSPEPGTLLLAALGLAPFGLRRLRRVW